MSDIKRVLQMTFNDEYVGTVNIWDDGGITAEFVETEVGATCIAFLVNFALRQLMTEEAAFAEFKINLN